MTLTTIIHDVQRAHRQLDTVPNEDWRMEIRNTIDGGNAIMDYLVALNHFANYALGEFQGEINDRLLDEQRADLDNPCDPNRMDKIKRQLGEFGRAA